MKPEPNTDKERKCEKFFRSILIHMEEPHTHTHTDTYVRLLSLCRISYKVPFSLSLFLRLIATIINMNQIQILYLNFFYVFIFVKSVCFDSINIFLLYIVLYWSIIYFSYFFFYNRSHKLLISNCMFLFIIISIFDCVHDQNIQDDSSYRNYSENNSWK